MRKLLGCLLLLIFALNTAACGFGEEEETATVIPALPNVGAQVDADKPVVMDVYWDATYSMQGYTTIPQDNMYQALPDNLEDIGTALGEVNFFRFGENIQPLEGRQHRQFMDSSFYTEVITAVNKVVENADSSHLTVIVTDLFESDADWSNVAKQMKAKYFANHQSLAVIGVKNPFKGDIFDVGYGGGGKIYYDTGNDASKYRPFYILVMGNDADVRSFVTKAKERFGARDTVKYLLFTDKLVASVPYLKDMDMSGTENLFQNNTLGLTDNRIVEMGIDDPDEEAELVATFGYTPYDDVCTIDTAKLKPVVIAHHLQDGQWVEVGENNKVDVELEPTEDGTGFKWSIEFQPRNLVAAEGATLLEAFVTPGRDGLQLPAWVQEWNVNSQDAFASGQFDGSKTVNFVRLISSLRDNSVSQSIPSIANAFIILKY